MGQCQVKIIFQNNLLTMLNKHLRLDKLHGFCLITFPQLILFYCQCLTSIEAQTDQVSRFLPPQQCRDARAARTPSGAADPPGASGKARHHPALGRSPYAPIPTPGAPACPPLPQHGPGEPTGGSGHWARQGAPVCCSSPEAVAGKAPRGCRAGSSPRICPASSQFAPLRLCGGTLR